MLVYPTYTMSEISVQIIWDAIQQVKGQVTTEVNAHLDLKMGSIQTGLIDIQQTLSSVTGQISELQEQLSRQCCQPVEAGVHPGERNAYLKKKKKVEDLENRSRRFNLRFLNVPEKVFVWVYVCVYLMGCCL